MQDNISVLGLHTALNEKDYICNTSFASNIASAIQSKPVGGAFLYGPAGTGKSLLPQVLSEILERKLYFHQCSAGTREDDLLMRIWPSEETTSGVKIEYGKIFEASKASQSEKVVVVLDEWDKTKPSADGFFLDFLQYGRLSVPNGDDVKANLDNMIIFFTANDERDFSEALLRRFPKIDLMPLAPTLVNEALKKTHKSSPFRPNAISLYQKCLMADMPKPATIQELRQLLDAISFLGKGADWDTLVYQYITKTDENHSLLSEAEKSVWQDYKQEQKAKLTPEAYIKAFGEDKDKSDSVEMPKMSDLRNFDSTFETVQGISDDDDVYGVMSRDDSAYSVLTDTVGDMPTEPQFIDWAEVRNDCIIAKKPVPLHNANELMVRFKRTRAKGEIVFTTEDISLDEMRRLVRGKYTKNKYSAKEIIARETYDGKDRPRDVKVKRDWVDVRWKDGKTEIIVNLGYVTRLFLAMQMNAKHNLIQLPELRNIETIITHPMLSGSDIVPFYLKEARVQDKIGNIMLKNLKRTNGYCQMLMPKPPQKYSDIDISSKIDDLHARKAKFQYQIVPDVKVIKANDIQVRLVSLLAHYDYDGNDCVWVSVGKAPDINVFKFALGLTDYIPLYSCFKTDTKNTLEHMQKSGWRVSKDNLDALHKNEVSCLFVSDHVIIWRNFWSGDCLDKSNALLSNKIKSTITLLETLKEAYEIKD